MPFRSSGVTLGLAKEVTQGTSVAPTFWIPETKLDGMEPKIEQIRDESIRGNDSVLQASQQGTIHSEPAFDTYAYPELIPYLFRAIVGPDTVTGTSSYTHTFGQPANLAQPPTWTLTEVDGVQPRSVPGCMLSELGIKVDAKAAVTLTTKWIGWPAVNQGTPGSYTPDVTTTNLSWAATCKVNAVGVDRLVSCDMTIKRAVEPIFTANGVQTPRQVFADALEVDGKAKVIYESFTADMTDYLNNNQTPFEIDLANGTQTASLRMTKAARVTAAKDRQKWLQLDLDISGVFNTTDAGSLLATVVNSVSTAY